jgi:hypothetical protein
MRGVRWHRIPTVTQPLQPGRKIYRAPCKKYHGKDRQERPQTEAASFCLVGSPTAIGRAAFQLTVNAFEHYG